MKLMLLIDADNVSVGVMEQAVATLLAEHGALHVRRAYCNAESAAKHQALFKRLGIRPVVNLAAGKNSTDIAMAVDALDLAISERPDLVAIASSDSDFAPLVLRLREKGCRVVGIGQQGKTGEATQAVYDAYTVFAHRAPVKEAAKSEPKPAPKPAPKPPPRKASASAGAAPRPQAARPVAAPAAARAAPAARAAAEEPAPAAAAAANPPAPDSPRKSARKSTRTGTRAAPAAAPSLAASPTAPSPAAAAAAQRATVPEPLSDAAAAILAALPELAQGLTLDLRVAAERLRAAGLLSKRGASTKLLVAHAQRFELLPPTHPQKVRLRA